MHVDVQSLLFSISPPAREATMRAYALVLFAALLIAACKSPTGGGGSPPPTPPKPSITGGTITATYVKVAQSVTGAATAANASGCSMFSEPADAFQITGPCSGFTATGLRAVPGAIIRARFTNGQGHADKDFVVDVIPQDPSGGFVQDEVVVQTGQSVTLQLNLVNAGSCTATLNPSQAASYDLSGLSTCPSTLKVNLLPMAMQDYTFKVYLTIQGVDSRNSTLQDSVLVRQSIGSQDMEPAEVTVVAGVGSETVLRSPTCAFLKQNGEVHRGTEFSSSGQFPGARQSPNVSSDGCTWTYTFSSGHATPGEYWRYIAAMRPDGTYTIARFKLIIQAPG